MIRKAALTIFFLLIVFSISSISFAMGASPSSPTPEAERVVTPAEQALAKEQIDNLRDISINSETISEGYGKFVKDVYSGKKYLYDFNDIAKKELIKIALDKNESWEFRWMAISSLNPDDPPSAFDMRIVILEDTSERIELRRVAVGSIASTKRVEKQNKAVDVLIKALKDPDDDIASSAADGLGTLKNKKAIGPLITSVKKSRNYLNKLLKRGWKGYKKGTTIEGSRLSTAVRALGELKANAAVPVLIEVIEDDNLDKHFLNITIAFAINALGEVKDKRALPALEKALRKKFDDQDMHSRIRSAIKEIKNK